MVTSSEEGSRTDPSFAGKTVLITGTARGVGRACAVRFAERGATVVGGNRLDQSETAVACGDQPGAFEPVPADVTDSAAVAALVERAAATGRIDAVVNVAGIVAREPLAIHEGEPWEHSVAVNLTAPFRELAKPNHTSERPAARSSTSRRSTARSGPRNAPATRHRRPDWR